MDTRYGCNPEDVKKYTTEDLRKEFLIQNLFQPGKINTTYSHIDRIIVGGAMPVAPLKLEAGDELRAEYFLQRREMGIINVGAEGSVKADGVEYKMGNKDGLYLGMGTKEIIFDSKDKNNPAKFYINSAPAHHAYPTKLISLADAKKVHLGDIKTSNKRTINQYLHPAVLQTCQLVMGMTMLEDGSVWNSFPCHTHERRMEVYFYFDMAENTLMFHFMGQPTETRHIVMRNDEAVISPSWSIHSGSGTGAYAFIWGMCGENQTFDDMDAVNLKELK